MWTRRKITKIVLGGISIGLLANQFFNYKGTNQEPNKVVVKDISLDLPATDIYLEADPIKRDTIKGAFQHAWSAYERDAFGFDEYHPISRTGSNLSRSRGIGYTIIDSLDTIQLMGLTEEYTRAREWIESELTFEVDDEFNTFETTIRVLGGLLSSYYLSSNPFNQNTSLHEPDTLFLDLAADLGERLLSSFSTNSGLPLSYVNLKERLGIPDKDNGGFISTAEAASLQIEFKWLAELLEDPVYWTKSERVFQIIKDSPKRDGLTPIFIDPRVNQFYFSQIRLGSRADSYYEYLLKQYLQTGKSEHVYKEMYDEACKGIKRHLVKISQGPKKLIHTIELAPSRRDNRPEYRLYNKQDHLVCFLPGLLMLGVHQAKDELDQKKMTIQEHENWWVGTELLRTCYDTYNSTASGLSPEIIHFHPIGDPLSLKEDWFIKKSENPNVDLLDGRYILRPETVESIFIAFRLTGDAKYREWGWQIFQSIEKHAKIQTGGYASIKDVNQLPVEYEDKMETFLLSETFKYLYLLFEDSNIAPLDKVVFNTEAHIFPIFEPSFKSNLI